MALIEQKLSQTTKRAEDLIQQQNPEKDFIFIGNEIRDNNIEKKEEDKKEEKEEKKDENK